jgi:hypothetical protein
MPHPENRNSVNDRYLEDIGLHVRGCLKCDQLRSVEAETFRELIFHGDGGKRAVANDERPHFRRWSDS